MHKNMEAAPRRFCFFRKYLTIQTIFFIMNVYNHSYIAMVSVPFGLPAGGEEKTPDFERRFIQWVLFQH